MSNPGAKTIASVEALLTAVRSDYQAWNTKTFPWFRGEPLITTPPTPLLPALFRGPHPHDENRLLQQFRLKAPSLGLGVIPPRDHTDQWLFLARHVGLPTRLLDWTEGLLVALLFAVYDSRGEPRPAKDGAVVWMLDPVALNNSSPSLESSRDNEFPLTWVNQPTDSPGRHEILTWLAELADDAVPDKVARLLGLRNLHPSNNGAVNFRRAWGATDEGTDLPIAVHGTSIHPRITAQKGCFTIHGKQKRPLSDLISDPRILRQYQIDAKALDSIRFDLRMAGVTYSTMYPDLDGLAVDLRSWF
jgi:FRG domain